MTQQNLAFKIALLGPPRVGKTSLLTALLAESQKMLMGSKVAMYPVGDPTKSRMARNQFELEGYILAGEFQSALLGRGTIEPFKFTLGIDPGVVGAGISIEMLDFPGGWLSAERGRDYLIPDWERVRDFIIESTVLLIPVDATLLMEALGQHHKDAALRLLTIAEVEAVARDWAIERQRRPEEPALAVFCPVKCESYFSDNGGLQDRSGELLTEFLDVYEPVIRTIQGAAHGGASILYAPVDTLGCVELVNATWGAIGGTDDLELVADYLVRQPAKLSRVGASDLMRALSGHLTQGLRLAAEARGQDLEQSAEAARQYAELRQGFFRSIWLWISRERTARREMAASKGRQAEEEWQRVAQLGTVLEEIASTPYGTRVQEL